MIAYRTVYIPVEKKVEKKCEVKFILYDRFGNLATFDTRKEAEKKKAIYEQGWCTVMIKEQVTPIE
jgi:hypothetical protein